MTKILIVAGLGNSGENHWQTHWLQKFENAIKLEQQEWDHPEPDDWLEWLNKTILKLDCPLILVAHSLGVPLVIHWANQYQNSNIKAGLLVAPADVDSPAHTPEVIRGFAPVPVTKLLFPSIVVASENDTFVSISRAQYFAAKWGSDFINIGMKGHINAESDLGTWEEGQLILQKLQKAINGY